MDTSNRHPADRLHDLRRQMEELKQEIDELRDYLTEHPDDLAGNDYEALIGFYQRRHVDLEGLEREIGKALLQRSPI